MLVFPRFDLDKFGLERSGTLIAFMCQIFVKNTRFGAELRPKNEIPQQKVKSMQVCPWASEFFWIEHESPIHFVCAILAALVDKNVEN